MSETKNKVKLIVGPDGKKMTVDGKKVGRPAGRMKIGLSRLKDDIWKTYIALGGQKFLYDKCKKDAKFTEKLLWKAIDLLPKEILQTNTENKTVTHFIGEEARNILNRLEEGKKPELVVNNEVQ